MRTQNTAQTFTPELRRVSSAEIAQIIKDARLMRAQAQAELIRSAGRRIARLGRTLAQPLVLAISDPALTVRRRAS